MATTKKKEVVATKEAAEKPKKVESPKKTGPYSAEGPKYKMGEFPSNTQKDTHRSFAQDTIRALDKSHKDGFTLLEFRTALVARAKTSKVTPPLHGWETHNMPTWCADDAQKWIVPVK